MICPDNNSGVNGAGNAEPSAKRVWIYSTAALVLMWFVTVIAAAQPKVQSSTTTSSQTASILALQVQTRADDRAGSQTLVHSIIAIPLDKVALVTQHLWNVGEPNGPPVPDNFMVGVGSLKNVQREQAINASYLGPALQAARRAKMYVVHSQPGFIAHKYPQYKSLIAEMAHTQPQPVIKTPEKQWSSFTPEERGQWTVQNWPGWQYMDFPDALKPLVTEPVTMASEELDYVLKQHGIRTLIYVGYATDMCLMNYTGGLSDMRTKFGYNTIVLRDATLATELTIGENGAPRPDDGVKKTSESLQLIERKFGGTATTSDFIAALEDL
jgi:nicotinamidase-related amidase